MRNGSVLKCPHVPVCEAKKYICVNNNNLWHFFLMNSGVTLHGGDGPEAETIYKPT